MPLYLSVAWAGGGSLLVVHFCDKSLYLQVCWFSFWPSLPFFTVGSMLSLRCSDLLIGCFIRYTLWHYPLQEPLNVSGCFILYLFHILIILIFTGLVEFNFFCQLLPHVECSGARLAVLLHVQGLSLGRCLSDEPICRRWKGLWWKSLLHLLIIYCISLPSAVSIPDVSEAL